MERKPVNSENDAAGLRWVGVKMLMVKNFKMLCERGDFDFESSVIASCVNNIAGHFLQALTEGRREASTESF